MPRGAVRISTAQPSQRQRQRAETRERIFRAALEEFRQVGADAAQIPRIAAAAGVVRGTFYYHFPSKEHVLLELRGRVEGEIADRLRPLRARRASIGDVLAVLFASIRETAAALGERQLLGDLMGVLLRLRMAAELDGVSPVQEELAFHIDTALRRGELRARAAPELLARMLLNSVFGLVVASRTPDGDSAQEFELLKDVLLRGLAAS
jgi:AcrR family transcriptional regulator